MAKGVQKSNKEVKKPKKDKKAAPAAGATFEKGISATGGDSKKKG